MEEKQIIFYNSQDELDDTFIIDFKKIFYILWSRKAIIAKVFTCVLLLFILMTFTSAKKYKVEADLYINKSNNSNMVEFNPYVISEMSAGGGMAALMSGGNGNLMNEIELMQSPLVIDKVIRENNIVYKKKWGIIPNKKEGQYVSTQVFLGKGKALTIENKKGTNILNITYKSKKPDFAYNIVNSVINNYIELHKQLNSEKSKSDKKILESEYNKAKQELNTKLNSVNGLPENAMNSTGGLSAMSAFSKSASSALSTLKGQVISGAKSRAEVTEESAKVAALASKLEWAKLVDEMSETSKVLVIKEPQKLEPYEYYSPKLFTNILMGIVFGFLVSLFVLVFTEMFDKKLSFSMLGDNVIYDLEKEFAELQIEMLANKSKEYAIIVFEKLSNAMINKMQNLKNIKFVRAEISEDFLRNISDANIITMAKIGETDSRFYKQIKTMLAKMNKKIEKEILI